MASRMAVVREYDRRLDAEKYVRRDEIQADPGP